MQCRSSQHTKAKAAQAPLWRPSSRKPASRFPPGGVSTRLFCWPVIRADRTDLRNTQQGRSIWRREAIADVIRPHLFYFDKNSMLRGPDPSDPWGRRERRMIRKIWLVVAVFTALGTPVMAQDPCVAPAAPAIRGGA